MFANRSVSSIAAVALATFACCLEPPPAAAGGEPIPPGITMVEVQGWASARALFDLDGDGTVEPSEVVEDPYEYGADDMTKAAQVGPAKAAAEHRLTLSLAPDGSRLTVTASGRCQSEVPLTGDYERDLNRYVEAEAVRSVSFLLGNKATFQITGSVTGAPARLPNQAGSTGLAEVRLVGGGSTIAQAYANQYEAPGSVALAESGTLEAGQVYGVGGECRSNAPRRVGPETFDGPVADGTWSFTLVVGLEEPSDLYTWVGGRAGAFGDPANWEPRGVPEFVEAEKSDTALVQGVRNATIDLVGAAAVSAAAAPGPVARRVGRFVVRRSQGLRTVGGVLEADSLSPVVGERSVEVGGQASLLLDRGGVVCRHAAIGTGGPGEVVVEGAGGYFEATGRLGVGADGSGRLTVRDGGTVRSAETVLGETDAQGSAVVEGAGASWTTGNIAVGLEDDGVLLVDAGGQVTSATGVLGFNLDGEERGRAAVRGADGAGTPSRWQLTSLAVRARGGLVVSDGGELVAESLRIGAEGSAADCPSGAACVEVDGGRIDTENVLVGHGGNGVLVVEGDGQFAARTTLSIGDFDGTGYVSIASRFDETQLFGDVFVDRGSLSLLSPARADVVGRLAIGTLLDDAFGTLALFGDPRRPEDTRLAVLGEGDSRVGMPAGAPAGETVAATGLLTVNHAVLEFTTPAHDLVIERTGWLDSQGGRIVLEDPSALVNRGTVRGDLIVEGDYVQGPTGTLRGTILAVPGPSSATSAPVTSGAATRAAVRTAAAKTKAPAYGPVVVRGDATLDGRLELQFGNGVAPRAGQVFMVLAAEGTVAGEFAEIVVRGLVPGTFEFDAALAGGTLALTSLRDAVALPAVSLKAKPRLKETKKKGGKIKLKRKGDASAPLAVAYRVGGSALPGIDYEALPGVVDIPARKKSATIVVRPIADGLFEGTETIEVELIPDDTYAPGLASKVTIELSSRDQ